MSTLAIEVAVNFIAGFACAALIVMWVTWK